MLDRLLALEVFQFLIVFARLGTVLAFAPGFGATYVPTRIRLAVALGVTVVIVPLLIGRLPSAPDTVVQLARLLLTETLVGLYLAGVMRMLFVALSIAGHVISFSTGLAVAQAFDPLTGSNAALITAFLEMAATVLVFATGLHLVMLQAVVDSYMVLPPGAPIPMDDMALSLSRLLSESVRVGAQLGAPFVVFSMVFQVVMAMFARLMPRMNVLFVLMPLKILAGLGLLLVVLPTMMILYLRHYGEGLLALTGG